MLVPVSQPTRCALVRRAACRLATAAAAAVLLVGPAPVVGAAPNGQAAVEMPTTPSTEPATRRQRGVPGSAAATAEQPLRAWHFAEGNSRNEFQTYFSVLNLSDRPAS